MNSINALSFKGRYIVKGNIKDIKETEAFIINSGSYLSISTTQRIKCGQDVFVQVYATDIHSEYVNKDKTNDWLKSVKGKKIKEALNSFFKTMFPTYTPNEINILNAQDILNNKEKFLVREGIILGSKSKTLGEQTAQYDMLGNRIPETRTLADGTVQTYNTAGIKTYEKTPDGSIRKYYYNGTPKKEILSDGTYRKYSERGTLVYEKLPDGTINSGSYCRDKDGNETFLRPNHKNAFTVSSEGKCEYYDENGNIDNSAVVKRTEDNLFEVEFESGEKQLLYPNGRIAQEINDNEIYTYSPSRIFPKSVIVKNDDGSAVEYSYRDREKILSKTSADGVHTVFDKKGNVLSKTTPDGVKKTYLKGILSSEQLSDGTIRNYKKGVISTEILPDDTRRIYINGRLKYEQSSDGSQKVYLPNGKLQKQISSSGEIIEEIASDDLFAASYMSFIMTVAWDGADMTKEVFSKNAKGDAMLAKIIKKEEKNRKFKDAVKFNKPTDGIEPEPITTIEERKYLHYLNGNWKQSGTDEISRNIKRAQAAYDTMLQDGITGISDDHIQAVIEEWQEKNPEKYEILFG